MSCSSFLFPPSFCSFYEELRRCVRQSNNKTTRTTRVWVQQREEKRWSLSSPIIKPPFMHFSLSFYYPPFGAEKMLSISLLSKKKKSFFSSFFPEIQSGHTKLATLLLLSCCWLFWWCERNNLVMAVINHRQTWRPL